MSWIDWTIMAAPMVVVFYIAWVTNKYVKGVNDFLAAGRVAGRYLAVHGQRHGVDGSDQCRRGVRAELPGRASPSRWWGMRSAFPSGW